ncbi:MAG: hypothetical protein CMJ31_14635 [Phycisphaerae bacterium]|nr:hypothetical protein [Phycisphaerae bacterium]
MKVQTRLQLLALVGATTIAGIVTVGSLADLRQRRAEQRERRLVESRSDLIGVLTTELGFDGLVHSMKNYLLRAEAPYLRRFRSATTNALVALSEYEDLEGLTNEERVAIARIHASIDAYNGAMTRIAELRDSNPAVGVLALDSIVRIDDHPATEGLATLAASRDALADRLEARLDRDLFTLDLVQLAFGIAGAGGFYLLSRRMTNSITTSVINLSGDQELDADVAVSLIEEAPMAVALIDSDNRVIVASGRWRELFTNGDPVQGLPFRYAFWEVDASCYDVLDDAMQGQSRKMLRERAIDNRGVARWIEWEAKPWRGGSDDEVRGVLISAYPLDTQITLEDAVTSSNERYELALLGARIGIWDWFDVEHDDAWWSPQLYELIGYTPAELPATLPNIKKIMPPDDRPQVFAKVDAALRREEIYDATYRLRRKDGQYRWFRGRAICFHDEQGRPRRMAGSIEDIHDRVTAENRLRERERELHTTSQRLELSMASAQQAAWEWWVGDENFTISDSGCTMLGYGVDEMPRSIAAWRRLVHPDDRPRSDEALEAHLRGDEERYDVVVRMRRSNGEWSWVRSVGAVVERNTEGQPTRIAGMNLDVDRERRLQEQLKQRSDEMERFVYTASHDLKSPIVTILGFLSHVNRDLEEGQTDRLPRFVKRIEDATERLKQSVDELLDVSRVNRITANPRAIDLDAAIREAVASFDNQIRERGVTLSIGVGEFTVWCDAKHVRQVVDNYLSNALRYGTDPVNPRISIAARSAGLGFIEIAVTDNGSGIDPAYADRVFGLFERLSTEKDGSGVGLAIVRKIAEHYNGRAWLDTDAESGTTFRVTLPAYELATVEVAEGGRGVAPPVAFEPNRA